MIELRQLTGIAAILRFPMPDIEDIMSDSDEDVDNETDIVNGHICNNVEPEIADEPKVKTQKTQQDQEFHVAATTTASTSIEATKKEVKTPKSSAIAAPKGATQKKNKFIAKKTYDEDDYGDRYDHYGDDYL